MEHEVIKLDSIEIDRFANLLREYPEWLGKHYNVPISNADTRQRILNAIILADVVDFKKLVPKKQMIESEPDNHHLNAASNLSFITWLDCDNI